MGGRVMTIRLVVNCVENLGLPLQCLDLKIMWCVEISVFST